MGLTAAVAEVVRLRGVPKEARILTNPATRILHGVAPVLRGALMSHLRFASLLLALSIAVGCHSPYYADRGAALGGLTGAGVGAIVGDQVGDAGAGAVIGAGIGALTGAAAGGALDEIQAENRAAIASQLGRQVQPGAATIDEVVAMNHAGVDPRLIANYVQNSGLVAPLNAADVIHLHQQGVPTEVIQAMQTPRPQAAPIRTAAAPGQPVIIQEHYYDHGPPCWRPRTFYYRHRHHRPHVGWGISVSN